MKIAVIGAGISGLSVAKLLSGNHEVHVFERSSHVGGIARTRQVAGATYHTIGGHCFNSKYKEVMDFVFSFYPEERWNKIERNAKIFFRDKLVSYPIEFSLKEIYDLDSNLALDICEDLFASHEDTSIPLNLGEWFIHKFGKTLAHEYFIPYNRKIWGRDPFFMSYEWVHDKLPIPNKREILSSLLGSAKDKMPHSSFYYPKSNNQLDFIRALSDGLKIHLNHLVTNIAKKGTAWIINGGDQYDAVISTVPMNLITSFLTDVPETVRDAVGNLKYNSVTTMFWSSEPTENTWTYFPERETIFHRHIHIGNFFRPRSNFVITEALGQVDEDDMIAEGKKIPYLIDPLSYHTSDHAYVVYDENYSNAKALVKRYLDEIGVNSLGRFGEWEYYNMDICIKSAMDLARRF